MDEMHRRLLLLLVRITIVLAQKKPLYLLGLFPMSGNWDHGPAMILSAQMAMEDVNAREDILPGYELKLIIEDTKCQTGYGVNGMYRQLYQPPTKILVFGAACSPVSEATATASHLWNVIQLSYISGSPALSDKTMFPLFFRLNSPRQIINKARIQFMQAFAWARVATIHQSHNLFSEVTNDLVPRLEAENITLISSEIFTGDPQQQVANLKRHDARIIFLDTYEPGARKVMCEAYKVGLYGRKYVWLISDFFSTDWYKTTDTDCTAEQITQVAMGSFSTEVLYLGINKNKGFAGYSPQEWWRRWEKRRVEADIRPIVQGAMGYDGIWTAALSLNLSVQLLEERGFEKGLEDFTYKDANMTAVMKEAFLRTHFQGIKGYLRFDQFGDVGSLVIIKRLMENGHETSGYYDPEPDNIAWLTENPIIWEGGSPPLDSTIHVDRVIYVEWSTYITLSIVAGLGLMLSIAFLMFNITYRNERAIKMSSPKMNNIILLGCAVAYTTVFLQEHAYGEVLVFCKVRTYTLMIGFSLAFGALFAKTWRVYAIFMNRTRRVVIKDEQLLLIVVAIVGLDVVISVVREVLDPLQIVNNIIAVIEREGGDLVITNRAWTCTSPYDVYFKGVVYAIKGLLLLFGAFLAMQTRKVKIAALNDSQYIGLCIYNVAVLSLLGVVLNFALADQVDLSYIFSCSFIILGTTLTQLIIFIPKVTKFRSQVEDEDPKTQFGTAHTPGTVDTAASADKLKFDALTEALEKKTQLLHMAEKELKELKGK